MIIKKLVINMVASACITTPSAENIINQTEYDINQNDLDQIGISMRRCPEVYGTCLVRFFKLDERDYYAECKYD